MLMQIRGKVPLFVRNAIIVKFICMQPQLVGVFFVVFSLIVAGIHGTFITLE